MHELIYTTALIRTDKVYTGKIVFADEDRAMVDLRPEGEPVYLRLSEILVLYPIDIILYRVYISKNMDEGSVSMIRQIIELCYKAEAHEAIILAYNNSVVKELCITDAATYRNILKSPNHVSVKQTENGVDNKNS